MNEEIKEILEILRRCKDYGDEVYLIKEHGATLLLDYITNLELENKDFKKRLKKQIDVSLEQSKVIDKAIEYMEGNCFIDVAEIIDILRGDK